MIMVSPEAYRLVEKKMRVKVESDNIIRMPFFCENGELSFRRNEVCFCDIDSTMIELAIVDGKFLKVDTAAETVEVL